jgi:DNA-binding IclR family transcriptional regulator
MYQGPAPKQYTSVTDRVFSLLDCFAPQRSTLTLSELSRYSGLALSTTHRLAGELVARGALQRGEDGKYQIGLKLWEIASLCPVEVDLRSVARPFLEDLYEATRQHVQLAVLDGTDAVYLERISARGACHVVARVGGRLPLHATAVGQVLLATASPQVQQEVLSGSLRRFTKNTLTTADQLRATIATVRREGYAITVGHIEDTTQSVAAPIIRGGTAVAALSVVIPVVGTDPYHMVPAVRATAIGISRALNSSEIRTAI